jgi:hypothetical protein
LGIQAHDNIENRSAPDFKDEGPPPSKNLISKSSDSESDSNTQSEESLNDIDPSNSHLVSGSDYSMCISENRVTHEAWYNQNQDNNSSDEGEANKFDSGFLLNGENSGEYSNLYDSDYVSK